MGKVYVSVKRESQQQGGHLVLIVVLSVVVFVIVSLSTRSSYNEAREDLLQQLSRERGVAEVNNRLRLELSAITRTRFIELKAKEKLGLKKPKEEEVYVLR